MRWFGKRTPAPAAVAPPPAAPSLADTQRWLDQLHWHTARRLHGLRQGQHTSVLRGQGLDLADLREYQPHDDVRHIDWHATARLQQPHVRVFHDDRDLAAWFVLDASASSAFGSTGQSMQRVAQGYVGIVARLLLRQGNRVGAIVHTGQPGGMQVLPPKAGQGQLWRLTQVLTAVISNTPRYTSQTRPTRKQPNSPHVGQQIGQQTGQQKGQQTGRPTGQQTDLAGMLRDAAHLVRSRSAVFVVSDFIAQPGWEAALGQLALRHDVIAVHLIDPMQRELPNLGLLPMRDPETGEQLWVDTANPQLRARHAQLAAEQDARTAQAFARAGVDVLELATGDDLPQAVLRQLRMRQAPRAAAASAALASVAAPAVASAAPVASTVPTAAPAARAAHAAARTQPSNEAAHG